MFPRPIVIVPIILGIQESHWELVSEYFRDKFIDLVVRL